MTALCQFAPVKDMPRNAGDGASAAAGMAASASGGVHTVVGLAREKATGVLTTTSAAADYTATGNGGVRNGAASRSDKFFRTYRRPLHTTPTLDSLSCASLIDRVGHITHCVTGGDARA